MFGRTRQLKDPGKKPGGGWVSKNGTQKSGQGTAKSAAAWKQDTLEGLEKGSRVWYKAGADSWVLGTLLTRQEESWKVALDSEAGEGTGQVGSCSACSSEIAAHPAVDFRAMGPCSKHLHRDGQQSMVD